MGEVLFNTSGSTGDAKTIIRTEESLTADAANLVKSFPEIWNPENTVVSSVRPQHMYGALWCVRAPAIARCKVDDSIVLSVEDLMAARLKYGKILFVTTPSFLEKALSHSDFHLLKGAFSAIITSGSLLREETSLNVAKTVGCTPTEIFGSTETGTVAFRRQTEFSHWQVVDQVSISLSPDSRLVVDSPFAMERTYVMGDIVEILSPRTFMLRGRADRLVKILESYVSLTEVERAFSAHPFVSRVRVETTSDNVPRIGALIVLSQEGIDTLLSGTYAMVSSRLRKDLLGVLGASRFPRRIRYVREIPVNEQGKTTAAAARAILDAWCQEPAVSLWKANDRELGAKIVFPPDAECFNGHFPEFPILPGVAQLFFIRYFASQVFHDFPQTATYRRLKFQKIVLPSKEVVLSVARKGEGAFSFSMSVPTGLCSSGLIERTSSL